MLQLGLWAITHHPKHHKQRRDAGHHAFLSIQLERIGEEVCTASAAWDDA
jgi:hypothetical protein